MSMSGSHNGDDSSYPGEELTDTIDNKRQSGNDFSKTSDPTNIYQTDVGYRQGECISTTDSIQCDLSQPTPVTVGSQGTTVPISTSVSQYTGEVKPHPAEEDQTAVGSNDLGNKLELLSESQSSPSSDRSLIEKPSLLTGENDTDIVSKVSPIQTARDLDSTVNINTRDNLVIENKPEQEQDVREGETYARLTEFHQGETQLKDCHETDAGKSATGLEKDNCLRESEEFTPDSVPQVREILTPDGSIDIEEQDDYIDDFEVEESAESDEEDLPDDREHLKQPIDESETNKHLEQTPDKLEGSKPLNKPVDEENTSQFLEPSLEEKDTKPSEEESVVGSESSEPLQHTLETLAGERLEPNIEETETSRTLEPAPDKLEASKPLNKPVDEENTSQFLELSFEEKDTKQSEEESVVGREPSEHLQQTLETLTGERLEPNIEKTETSRTLEQTPDERGSRPSSKQSFAETDTSHCLEQAIADTDVADHEENLCITSDYGRDSESPPVCVNNSFDKDKYVSTATVPTREDTKKQEGPIQDLHTKLPKENIQEFEDSIEKDKEDSQEHVDTKISGDIHIAPCNSTDINVNTTSHINNTTDQHTASIEQKEDVSTEEEAGEDHKTDHQDKLLQDIKEDKLIPLADPEGIPEEQVSSSCLRKDDMDRQETPTEDGIVNAPAKEATVDSEETKPKDNRDDQDGFYDQDPGDGDQQKSPKQEEVGEKQKPDTEEQTDGRDQRETGGENKEDINTEEDQRLEEEKKAEEMRRAHEDKEKMEEERKQTEETEQSKQEKLKEIEEKVPRYEKESPLDQLLKKNVEIDGSVESISTLETAVMSTLQSMEDVMKNYLERLKLQPLKDFTTDLGKFRGDFSSINEAYKMCGMLATHMNHKLKDLRHVTENVASTINRKFQNEDMSTWIDLTEEEELAKTRLQEETIAAEKVAMAKATEARTAVAVATVKVAESQQFVSETELQATEAEALSNKCSAQAQMALIAAEEAKIAAEERKRAEDAAKKRSEERTQLKAEEEKKKQEQDELKANKEAERKGTTVKDELKMIETERETKERERRDPKNWPRYIYSVVGQDFDPGVGCAVRAISGSLKQDEIECVRIDQTDSGFRLQGNEELISNIIQIKPVDPDKKFIFEEPVSLAFPYCVNRIPSGREAVIKFLLPNGKWTEQPTTDCQFDDIRELRFVETRTRRFGTYVVLLRLKKDTMTFTRKGNKVTSSTDSRISFMSKPGAFKQNINIVLEAQTLEINTISDMRQRAPAECQDLLAGSPVVAMSALNRKLPKSLIATVPLPPNAFKPKRPMTAIKRDSTRQEVRPQTARLASSAKENDDTDEEIHFVRKDSKVGWTKLAGVRLYQPKNKDIVTFEIDEVYEMFVILRTKSGLRDAQIEKMAGLLEREIHLRNVQVLLRQKTENVSEVTITCVSSSRADRAMKNLDAAGYEEGPPANKDLVLREGQTLTVKFRGNVKCSSGETTIRLVFNTHIQSTRNLLVEEVDKFAQKALTCYRGFAQIYTKALVKKPTESTGANQQPKPGTHAEMVEAEVLLSEMLISLPKPDVEPPKPLKIISLPIQEGPLTDNVLRYIATEMGDEWKKVAMQLNLQSMRIQAILRQNVNKDTPNTRYDMLVTWAKRIPKSVDKVNILCQALTACGRTDLAEDIRDRGDEYRRQRTMGARSSFLRQAFVKVAKTKEVFLKWKTFAKRLGVPEEEIVKIEEKGGSGQEKCFHSLETWQHVAGEGATVPELASQLRTVRQIRLSREVEAIMTHH